jgi:dihydroflavonol-4-reductase
LTFRLSDFPTFRLTTDDYHKIYILDSTKDKRVFVTGGTGLIGSYLLRYLVRNGYTRVRALKRATSRMDLVEEIKGAVEWVEGDLEDIFSLEEALQGVQQVYHCAAVVSFQERDAQRIIRINTQGAANVVNLSLRCGVEKLLHVSSTAALGWSKPGETVTEKSHWQKNKLNSNYSISKHLSEQEAWRGMAEGLPTVVVNPSVVLGSGFWSDAALKLFDLAWKEFPFYTKGGSGFVDVRDVARFMIMLMESDITGERFIRNAENLPFYSVQEEIARQLGKRPPYFLVRPWMQQIIWRADRIRSRLLRTEPLITRENAASASRTIFFDNTKSVETFSFEYTPVSRTIAETAKQFIEASEEGFVPKVLPLI